MILYYYIQREDSH